MLSFEPEAMQILMEHSWPGNVRELENVVERAVVLATTPSVPAHVLPDQLQQASGLRISRDQNGSVAPDASLFEIVADFERRRIIEALDTVNQSQTDAVGAYLNTNASALFIDEVMERSELTLKFNDPNKDSRTPHS